MTSCYLDASALLPILVPDAHSDTMVAWLSDNRHPLIVSDFVRAEASASISRRFRMGLLDRPQAELALAQLDSSAGRMVGRRLTSPADIAACERLVRRFELKLLAPDALHIAMVLADGATLVTFDERQAQAMRQLGQCVVPG